MDELIEFLRARLDEEKAEAEKQPDGEEYPLDPWTIHWEETGEWNNYSYVRIAKKRVLAEDAVKRGIVEQFTMIELPEQTSGDTAVVGAYTKMQAVLRLLAVPYTAHPDYRSEWLPTL